MLIGNDWLTKAESDDRKKIAIAAMLAEAAKRSSFY
jgi:hypothetical protein